jgi:hypothetical protein
MRTHLPSSKPGWTLCGKPIFFSYRGASANSQRRRPLVIIDRNALVDSATCQACQRVDDAQSVANYRRECKAAGIDP